LENVMNNIHRIVWNAACGRWVVASELACRGPRAGQARAAAAPRPLLLALAVSLASIGGAGAQTIQFPGAPVDIGSDTRTVDGVLVANGATGVIVGDGGTLVHQGSDFRIGGTVNNSQQSLDMRGLSNYVFDGAGATFSVSGSASGGAINTRGVSSGLVNLAAGSNVITASQFGVADRIRNVSGLATNQGTLRLGRYNAINADMVTIGVSQTVGTLNFQDGITDGMLVLRGSDGSSAVSSWNIAQGSNSNYTGALGVVDLRGGTLDAKVGALTIATSLFGTASATGTLTLGRGVLEADTVLLGQRSSTSGNGGTTASLNIGAGGTVLANAITMGSRTGTTGTVSSTITLDGGALRAGSILAGAGTATRSIAFNDGVLGNRADGQDMTVNVPIVLAATGSHRFQVDGSDALMTVSGRVSGADGSLTKAGDGVLALTGNNTYSGTTTVNQGLIRFQNGANLGTGRIALDGGGLQWATGNTTDISARLDALGSNGAVLDTNGNAVTLASALTGDGGQLVKRGDGTLTLTGDNTHTGTTWIEQGTLALGDGGSSGTLAGDIANNAQLVLNRSDRILLAGSISGSGELVQAGNGTAVLTGNNVHTGGTRVEAGTLQLGDGGSTGNLAGRVTLAGGTGLTVDRSDTFLLGADVAGAGALIQAGTGTTVLDGDLTHTGGTTIAAGALRLGNGGTSGSVLGDIDNDGTLEFNRSDDFTLANAVRGSGGLVQMGAGILRIADDQAYTGATRVAAGTLLVDGSIRSDTAVAGGATLGGSGSIHGDVVNAGLLRPGSGTDYGSLTVHGNYVGNNGQLALNTWLGEDGAPSSLLVIDGGNASGSTQVMVNNTNSGEGHTVGNGILVVAATNGATTQADAFSLGNHARNGALGYQLFRGDVDGQLADNWYLRNSFIVPPPGPDPVDEGGPAPVLPIDPIDPIDPEVPLLPGTYPILGRELATYGVIQPVARELGLLTLGTLRERNGADTRSIDGRAAWVRVTARSLDNGYRSLVAPGAKGELSALQIGSDLWQSGTDNGSASRLGGYLAHGRSNIDVRGVFSNDDSTGYVRGDTGSLDLQATAAGLSWTTLGTRGGYLDAVVQATRYSGSASAGPVRLPTRGEGYIASLETGYPFNLPLAHGSFVLAPQLQLIWQQVRFDRSQDAAGAVAVGSTRGVTGRLGVSGTWQLQAAGHVQWSPYVALDYWHDPRAQSTVTFAGKDSLPLEAAASRVVFSAGLKARVSDRFSVFAAGGYERSTGDVQHQKRSSVSANLGLQFHW
jgi:outer membrane autotransporter protein